MLRRTLNGLYNKIAHFTKYWKKIDKKRKTYIVKRNSVECEFPCNKLKCDQDPKKKNLKKIEA